MSTVHTFLSGQKMKSVMSEAFRNILISSRIFLRDHQRGKINVKCLCLQSRGNEELNKEAEDYTNEVNVEEEEKKLDESETMDDLLRFRLVLNCLRSRWLEQDLYTFTDLFYLQRRMGKKGKIVHFDCRVKLRKWLTTLTKALGFCYIEFLLDRNSKASIWASKNRLFLLLTNMENT